MLLCSQNQTKQCIKYIVYFYSLVLYGYYEAKIKSQCVKCIVLFFYMASTATMWPKVNQAMHYYNTGNILKYFLFK